jgi:hypothetical protein
MKWLLLIPVAVSAISYLNFLRLGCRNGHPPVIGPKHGERT